MAKARGTPDFLHFVAAAKRFLSARPWTRWSEASHFAFELPGEEGTVIAFVAGRHAPRFGMVCAFGPDAEAMIGSEEDPTHGEYRIANLYFEPGSVDSRYRRDMQSAGWSQSILPVIAIKETGKDPRAARRHERQLVTWVLNAFIKTDANSLLDDAPDRSGGALPLIRASGKVQDPVVEVTTHRLRPDTMKRIKDSESAARPSNAEHAAARKTTATGTPRDVEVFPDLENASHLPESKQRWGIAFETLDPVLSGVMKLHEPRLLLVADLTNDQIVIMRPMDGANWDAVIEALNEAFYCPADDREPVLPETIVFLSEELGTAFTASMSQLGIRCHVDEKDKDARRFVDGLIDALAGALGGAAALSRAPKVLPAPDDLDGWKRADVALTQALMQSQPSMTPRLRRKFFGDDDVDLDRLDGDDPSMRGSFYEWRLFDHRSSARSSTLAERFARSDLPECWRILIERRANATPTLATIDAIDAGKSLDIVDVYSGQRWTIHDHAMSMTAKVGLVVALRVYAVGEYYCAMLAGPILSAHQIDDATRALEEDGFDPAKGFVGAAHLLGRLWRLAASPPALPTKLVSAEGDRLCFIKATFHTSDAAALTRALDARPDSSFDGESWACFAGADDGGPQSVLGHIRVFGDEVLVETITEARLVLLRSWLDDIPGIEHRATTKQDPMELVRPGSDRKRRRDDEASLADIDRQHGLAPEGPEGSGSGLVANLEVLEYLRRRQLAWLDEEIPMFGGRTPREVAKDPVGRARVAAMIRSMPRPGGVADSYEVPRAEMLRELGIESVE